jgi:methylenetetrahydrofolate reductase (NADPH)
MIDTPKDDHLKPSLYASQAFASKLNNINVSFEFFPPKTEKMEESLWQAIRALEALNPKMVSVTYGAGGSTRERTHATVQRILKETFMTPAAHLTCVGATKAQIDEIAADYYEIGVRHIVALRGDMPTIGKAYAPHNEGYVNAADLVGGLKKVGNFDISVAAYPETHPDSPSVGADIDNLKRKIDAGADRAITQYFFDVDVYFRFMDRVLDAGITVPIVPGIMPVSNFKQAKIFSERCGMIVPDWMSEMFEGLDDEPEIRRQVAASIASEQCLRLYQAGVKDFHFYTLNRANLTKTICHMLGVRPKKKAGGAS